MLTHFITLYNFRNFLFFFFFLTEIEFFTRLFLKIYYIHNIERINVFSKFTKLKFFKEDKK